MVDINMTKRTAQQGSERSQPHGWRSKPKLHQYYIQVTWTPVQSSVLENH